MKILSILNILFPTTLIGISIIWWNRRKKRSLCEPHSKNGIVKNKTIESTSISNKKSSFDLATMNDLAESDHSITESELESSSDSNCQPVLIDSKVSPLLPKSEVLEESVCETFMEESNAIPVAYENNVDVHEAEESVMNDECADIFKEESIILLSNISKRKRNQSSCGDDSAIVEDYSSDSLSVAGSIESQKLIDNMVQALDEINLSSDKFDNQMKSRDWYAMSVLEECQKPWVSYETLETNENSLDKIMAKKEVLTIKDLGDAIDCGKYEKPRVKKQFSKEHSSPKKQSKSKAKKHDDRKPDFKSPSKAPQKKTPKKQKSKVDRRGPTPSEMDKSWRKSPQNKDIENDIFEVKDYQYPQTKCGRLIGKAGKNVTEIKQKTGATVCIECEYYGENQIVSISGLTSQISKAETFIIEKFGNEFKPMIQPEVPPSLKIENLNCDCDVIVTAIDDCAHFHVQMFKEEIDEKICKLQTDLANCYSVPRNKYIYELNEKPSVGELCIALVDNTWCRLKVETLLDKEKAAFASYVDYGGTLTIPLVALMKIRHDFLDMPSLAHECYLAHVTTLNGDHQFSYEATSLFGQIVQGKLLKATIVATLNEIPCVDLTFFDEETQQMIDIGQELRNWGLVGWS